ncbi:MAG: exosortase F system-associated protein [Flavobacterium sp.]|jgi:exosortase F-associated protein|uniref:Exosortase F system-associated protein n=1 Tax=Flavobacterium macrobrachii TaxID=591204 RepID=A0ABS2CWG1_9FLAO|nr:MULTISPECIES: exosortase F system-associated protein [Flavobacterium]MBM6498520.1 exosortase F system-associated protein [Flavobacterium macrobrachii]MCZ8090859.1 exosortase F system-associated protein [Flavobacterium sp.]MCZ8330334.1 exosortase F system-associated protein [Flavobacterium sp.]PZO30745.1 MAG: exosortase F system-associated protein [Flavobacteriaceae bacterium]
MLQQLLQNKKKVAQVSFLVLLLISIRAFENTLFYDPFLNYFKSEYANLPFPEISVVKLFLSLGFRFYLNSVISLFLLYVIFNDGKMVKFSILLYMILGSILMISFFFVLNFFGEESKMTLFYIRRFIIQPIFILLFIPAFYYQKQIRKS